MPNPTTEAELKSVIETPVRAGYCLECNHKAFEHEIGMNTRQTGQCLVKGCSCMSLDTPSREELGDEVERLINDHSRQAGEIERLRTAISLCDCVECGICAFEISPFNPAAGFCWNCHKLLVIEVK